MIKREDVLMFLKILTNPISENGIADKKGPMKFIIWATKNKNKLQSYITEMEEINKKIDNKNIIEYEKERIKLLNKYAEKNDDGSFILNEINDKKYYAFNEKNKELANKEMEKLQEKFKDILKEWEETQLELVSYYNEKINIDLLKLDEDYIPDNCFNTNQLDFLIKIKAINIK